MEARQNNGFVKQAAQHVIRSVENTEYSVSRLAGELSLSREQTHRKLKKYTDLSTGQFIRYLRLLLSIKYLSEGSLTVAETGYKAGFNDPGYFSKCFHKEFGIPPGKMRRNTYNHGRMSAKMKKFIQLPEIRNILSEQEVPLPEAALAAGTRRRLWLTTLIPALVVLAAAGIFFSTQYTPKEFPLSMTDIGRIGILPLTNRTGESRYNQVGEISSSWLSGKLDELENIRTVPYFTIKQYAGYAGILPGDPDGKPTFRDVTGAGYMLTGSYYAQEDKLIFDTRLVDAHTQETVYHLPAVSGSRDSIMHVVEELRLELAGLLLNLEKVKLGKLDPPGYEAYMNYVNGLHELRNGTYPKRAYDYFRTATQLDTNFVMAQIFVSWFTPPQKRDSLLNFIKRIPMTEYERQVYMEVYYTYTRDYHQALSTTLDNLQENPYDYYLNMEAAHLAKSLFYPELALGILNELEDPLKDDFGTVWYYYKIWNYTESLAMMGEYDSVLKYMRNIPEKFHTPATPLIILRSMISLNADRPDIEKVIEKYSHGHDSLLAENYCAAAYEYKLNGREKEALYFSTQAIPLMQKLPGEKAILFDLTDAYYLNDDLQKARQHIAVKLAGNPRDAEFRIYLAMTEAAMGNEKAAYQAVSGLLDRDTIIFWRRHEYEHQSDYLLARVNALLGKKQEALSLLKQAKEKGQLYHTWDYDRDIFLLPVFEEPGFRELTAPRIYPDDIKLH